MSITADNIMIFDLNKMFVNLVIQYFKLQMKLLFIDDSIGVQQSPLPIICWTCFAKSNYLN